MAVPNPDPELLSELDRASESGADVEVVVQIRRAKGKRPDPAAVRKAAAEALTRAGEASSSVPGDVNVMASLATAYVRGPAGLIRELLAQPEIVDATQNRRADGVSEPPDGSKVTTTPTRTPPPRPASGSSASPRPPDHTV